MSTRQTVSLGDINLSYLEWKKGTEPLLLLHGLADHGGVWSSLADALPSHYHIIAPDLRGHGDSEKPKTGYQFAQIIQDLQGLMTHLGWDNAHILGHSWTGKLLPMWATQSPQSFRSMILVDPFFIGRIPRWFRVTFPLLYRVLPFLQAMGPFESEDVACAIAQQLKQYRGWSPLQAQVFRDSIEQQSDGTWRSKFTPEARDGVFEEVMHIAGLTQPLSIPTLFIKPEGGLNRSAWQMQPYYTYLTHLTVQEVPGNHWAFLVEPDAFNQEVAAFLAKL
ncbi:alpha/beta hydrolase [Spirulina subsalsa FACHB-351]|uniref:Alpha/beta hydrolase n=1 Tax=Spirulina subsalsa FACHB-351 TaxID=234711 RepID=A0ABT3L116_9CYAN|nr:alpha/beta hydrolase [Spirulina subsalsa]MCW6035183.1 alpha/beta hydrolase [Spirulina subsalsa FACHB-351]